ncbi:sugar phosphate nucleotidyltransferase [Thermodesulfovibrio sp. 3462-1]|uniref:Sugar phosphate nucleotidyltransferase n=1 Tax=Thermodesulfovibrio obliviosus TaxID=3118332 RepID=A0AAU8H305_9BACT
MKAVILAGGSGTRLFPLSRKNFPKQFLSIDSSKSLFQKTVERCLKAVENVNDIVIITNNEYQFHEKTIFKDRSKVHNVR